MLKTSGLPCRDAGRRAAARVRSLDRRRDRRLLMFGRSTHLKVMLVSLILCAAVVGVCLYAKPQPAGTAVLKASTSIRTAGN